jgi:hypothetical protein
MSIRYESQWGESKWNDPMTFLLIAGWQGSIDTGGGCVGIKRFFNSGSCSCQQINNSTHESLLTILMLLYRFRDGGQMRVRLR